MNSTIQMALSYAYLAKCVFVQGNACNRRKWDREKRDEKFHICGLELLIASFAFPNSERQ